MTAPDYTPKNNAAEFHITYRCNLRCPGCNRGLSIADIPVPDMTMRDVDSFIEQMLALGKRFTIVLLGGEPTLHPDILNFVDRLHPHVARIKIVSNGFTEATHYILAWAESKGALIDRGSFKKNIKAFYRAFVKDTFIDPSDFGINRTTPCDWHSGCSGWGCGFSVDSLGYTVCCIGGVIDSLRSLNVRTKKLADLFDPDFARWQTEQLCKRCGAFMGLDKKVQKSMLHLVDRIYLSDSWLKASRYEYQRLQTKKRQS